MASLSVCLSKAMSNLTKEDVADVKAAYKDFMDDNYPGGEAAVLAAKAVLEQAISDRDEIVRQITAAGGIAPDMPELLPVVVKSLEAKDEPTAKAEPDKPYELAKDPKTLEDYVKTGEKPSDVDWSFVPNAGWREHLIRARAYAAGLKIDHRGMELPEIVKAIDRKLSEHQGVPEGVTVRLMDYTIDEPEAQIKGGEYKAVAERKSPWAVEDGYGKTPEEARANALQRLLKKVQPQTSLVPEATTKEKIAAEAKAKERKGGNEAMDVGMFGSDKDQTDLVDMAKQESKAGSSADLDAVSSASITEPAEQDKTVAPATGIDAIRDRLLSDEGFKTIVEARKFSKENGVDGTNKEIDEAIETAVVAAARERIEQRQNNGAKVFEIYRALTKIYDNQPNLAVRTSTSVTNQAYSTPMPLAYLASRLAGVQAADLVYEPTAGNGALLIEADVNKVVANEIEPGRARALREQGFATVKSLDATGPDLVRAKSADAVIMNPPFGAVREDGQSKTWTVDGLTTTAIDHAIALNALTGMTDDGKAVLILGGIKAESLDERRAGYRGQSKRKFFAKLYKTYNVTDHFTVSGDLYKKQGAGWPVDVVVIDGRGTSKRPLPAAEPPAIFNSWNELEGKLPNAVSTPSHEKAAVRRGRQDGGAAEAKPESTSGDAGRSETTVRSGTERLPAKSEDDSGRVRGDSDRGKPGDVRESSVNAGADAVVGDRVGGRTDKPAAAKPREPVARKAPPPGSGQALYTPTSNAVSLDTLVPTNMAQATKTALDRVSKKHGDLDKFVAERLGYETDADGMYFLNDGKKERPFSAEQVDALATSIDNIERGAAYVLGWQTGIGKGRVVAGTIRYAIRKGWTPVFVTEKPDLYGDMFRDMTDIGMSKMLGREPRAFMTNTGESVPLDDEALAWKQEADQARADGNPIPKRRGRFLVGGGKAAQESAMRAITSGKPEHDIVFTTYDQMNTIKQQETDRRNFLRAIAPNSLIVMDESHTAGGQGEKLFKKRGVAPDRAEFARDLIKSAAGVMYASATFAKRPDVMDLYARTDMGKAVDDPKMLPILIQRGGIPMQQIVATMLSDAGQMSRLERSFEGVEYNVVPVPVDLKTYGQFSDAVRAVFEFDMQIEEMRSEFMQDILDQMGATQAKDAGVGTASANSTAFASIMHNIVNQMLLSIKADQVAARAIEARKAGEKPVIALASTMESFISDYADDAGVMLNSPIDITFGDVMTKYLDRTLRITIKSAEGEKSHVQIPVKSLPPSLQKKFAEAKALIQNGNFGAMPVSPIDWIRHRVTKAGYSIAEVTGRKSMIDYGAGNMPKYIVRPKSEIGPSGKRSSIAAFNRGSLDVLILNRSGSTGVSMHASSKFKDQSLRHMIIAQAEGNIDTHLQMLGRVHRTGQVRTPRYSQIAAEIPAEARPTAVLMKKMASLNANTTGARGSVFMADSVDFMNEYGDRVVANIVSDEPEINFKLGSPLKENDKGLPTSEDAARRVTGRLVLLSPQEQTELLNRIQDEYKAEIERLDALGENALEAKTVDLKARLIDATPLKDKTGEGPFKDSAQIEKMSVKAQGRAMAPSEVVEAVSEFLRVPAPEGSEQASLADFERRGRAWADQKIIEVSRRAREWIAEDVAAKSEDSRASVKVRHEDGLKRWMETARLAAPGARVTLRLGDRQLQGIVLAMERHGKAKNPVALGTWRVKVAVPDSARTIDLPMSKLYPPGVTKSEDEPGIEIVPSQVPFSGLISQLEDARREGREDRYIVTGNILAGYDTVHGRGQIVNFTMEDGSLRPGIMMSRDFMIDKFMESRTVRFRSADQVAQFLDRAPMGEVRTSDKFVTMTINRGRWLVETAAGRGTGGRYYTDSKVRDALRGTEFQRYGSVMRAELDRSGFVRVVEAIRSIGGIFETTDNQDLAQEIIRKSPAEDLQASVGTTVLEQAYEDAIYAGETYELPQSHVSTQHNAIRPLMHIVPEGTPVGVLFRVEPLNDTIDPLNQNVVAHYREANGGTFAIKLPASRLGNIRALVMPGRFVSTGLDVVALNNLSPVENLSNAASGQVWHEVIHVYRNRELLKGHGWGRLLAHAAKLRILDRGVRQTLKDLGDSSWVKAPNRTIRATYSTIYANHPKKVEYIRQESVAYMLELWHHGAISDADMAPVRDILEDIRAGRVSGNSRAAMAGVEPAYAIGKPQSDQDALGYYSKLLRVAYGLKQEKGTPEQMLAMLKKEGAKDAEIEATGLNKLFGSRGTNADAGGGAVTETPSNGDRSGGRAGSSGRLNQVTKDEIIKYLEENRVGVREVRYGNTQPAQIDALLIALDGEARRAPSSDVRDELGDIAEALRGGYFTAADLIIGRQAESADLLPETRIILDRIEHRLKIDQGLPKYSSYSLDPSNPTYRETVLHLPATAAEIVHHPTSYGDFAVRVGKSFINDGGKVKAFLSIDSAQTAIQHYKMHGGDFRTGHFPEPNIIGHMMTSMTTHEGRPVFTVDQIQSDWGQKLRDGGVRDEAKIADLKARIEKGYADVNRLRPADLKTSEVKHALEGLRFYGGLDGIAKMAENPDAVGAQTVLAAARKLTPEFVEVTNALTLAEAELRTAEASSPGNPLVNTTDQWVNTVLRRAIRQASEAGADYIAIPSGDTVLSYNPGDEYGMGEFYDKIVPKNLKNLLTRIDRETPAPERIETVDSPSGKTGLGKGFTLFKLTDKVKRSVLAEGQPLFAISRLYHSTPAKFDRFSNEYTDEVGFHFGTKNQAHNRAYVMSNGNLWTYFRKWRDIPVDIEIDNPVTLSTDPGSFMPTALAKQLVKDGLASHELIMEVQRVQLGLEGSPDAAKSVVRDYLISKGYDAIRYPNHFEGVGDYSYMTFGTGNVKDARTGDILYAISGNVRDGFKVAGQALRPSIDTKAQADVVQALTDAVEIVRRIAGAGVKVEFRSAIPVGEVLSRTSYQAKEARDRGLLNESAGGFYRPGSLSAEALIGLSTNAPGFDLATAAGHEAWHHVEGVLATPAEKHLLASKSELARMRRLAANELGISVDDPILTSMPDYEVRAYAFQRYRRLREEGAAQASGLHIGVRKFFDHMIQVFRNVQNALRGKGYDSFESIFALARSGEMAKREPDPVTFVSPPSASDDLVSLIRKIMDGVSNDNGDTSAQSAAQVQAFMLQRIGQSDGGALTEDDAIGAYQMWAEDAGIEPMGDQELISHIQRTGISTMRIAGRRQFIGLRLLEENEQRPANPAEIREKDAFELARDAALGFSMKQAISRQIERLKSVIGEKPDFARIADLEAMQQAIANDDSIEQEIYDNVVSMPDDDQIMGALIPRPMPANRTGGVLGRKIRRTLARAGDMSDLARVKLQDKALPIRRIAVEMIENQTGAKVPIDLDTYVAEGLYHGRAGERIVDLQDKLIEPFIEHLRASGLTVDEVGDYLYARHAIERNDAIEAIDPATLDGSGMTDSEATSILTAVVQSGKQAEMDKAAGMVDQIILDARDTLLRSGLIDRGTYDAWSNKYKHYAPLRGFELGDDENPDRVRSGRGFDIRGPESRRALGRKSKADNPVMYAILQAQQAIVRAEKNRVNETLYRMIQANPNPAVWAMYRGESKRRVNPSTGMVETYWVLPPFVRNDAVHGVKIKGKQFWMELKHPALARAMRGVGSEIQGTIIGQSLMSLTRTYASLLTSYNPEFMVSNFFRDVETAILNSLSIVGSPKGVRAQIVKDAIALKSIRGAFAALRGDTQGEYAKWFDEYRLAGGKISFMEFNDVERIKKRINSSLKAGKISRALSGAAKYVEDINSAVENGVRLSTYVAMRKARIEKDRAAFTARELTVNFNRKGEYGPGINAAYLFFNASIQGSTRVAQAFIKSKAVRYAVGGIFATGFALDLFNMIAGGDDDDGENLYDKIPEWIRDRNIIIMNPFGGGDYIMIPMAYGYNTPYLAGQELARLGRGKSGPLEAAARISGATIDAFNPMGTNPLGSSGSFWQFVAPTMLDPGVQVLENKTWYGGPIQPVKFDKNKPDSQNYFTSAPWWWVDTAKVLNSMTGGNEARAGYVDISPEVIEHYAEFAGGGVAKFLANAFNSGSRVVNGEEWLPEKTPFIRRLYGKATAQSRAREFYDIWDDVDRAHYEVKELTEKHDKPGADAARTKYAPELRVYSAMKGAKNTLKNLRKQRDKIKADDNLDRTTRQQRLDDIDTREKDLIARVLKQYRDVQKARNPVSAANQADNNNDGDE